MENIAKKYCQVDLSEEAFEVTLTQYGVVIQCENVFKKW